MVGMYTLSKDSIRIRNKNKGNRKRNKKVNFRNSVEESSYEHVGRSSNNSNESSLPESSRIFQNLPESSRILPESFLPESSDTLNDSFIGLSEQCLAYPKKLIIGYLNINYVRNKFSSLQQTVLSKTNIFLLSETKIDNQHPDSQFFTEGFKVYREDRTKNGRGHLLYVNENLPGKIINS